MVKDSRGYTVVDARTKVRVGNLTDEEFRRIDDVIDDLIVVQKLVYPNSAYLLPNTEDIVELLNKLLQRREMDFEL